jgi:hypothetical protein
VTISLKHAFNSGKSDGADATRVRASNWNAEHAITMATARILGRVTASTGVVEELTADNVYTMLGIVTGTRCLFHQTSAPTGWTKDVSINDKSLRVVSGSVSSGGTTAFSSVFGSGKTTGGTSITQANLPSYNLSVASITGSVSTSISNGTSVVRNQTEDKDNDYTRTGSGSAVRDMSWDSSTLSLSNGSVTFGGNVPSGGSGTAHTHTLSLDLQYVDVIIAAKA